MWHWALNVGVYSGCITYSNFKNDIYIPLKMYVYQAALMNDELW